MNVTGCLSPGSHPTPDSLEPLAAHADLQSCDVNAPDVDWHAGDFDRIAEQTLGGTLPG